MSEVATAIMDAAEDRIRLGGFSGFSFREIAADVGVKSSSVHYHFPTKENLAAAVVRRYAAWTDGYIDEQVALAPDPATAWTNAFRDTLTHKRMCPCTVLGAGLLDLPQEVAVEVKAFYAMCLDKMVKQGLDAEDAAELLSTITGAVVVANALNDVGAYDRATAAIPRAPARAPAYA